MEIGTDSRILMLADVVLNLILGAYSSTDQHIFTKFVVLVDNGVPQRVKSSKYASFKHPNGGYL